MDIFKYKNGKFVISEGYGSAKTSEDLEQDIMDLSGSKKKEEPRPAQKPIPGTENPKTFAGVSLTNANTIADIQKLSKMPRDFEEMLDKMYIWGKKNGIKFNDDKITNEIIAAAESDIANKRPTATPSKPQVKSSLTDKDIAGLTDPRVGPAPSGPLRA